jgi:fimbrial chaperone protein
MMARSILKSIFKTLGLATLGLAALGVGLGATSANAAIAVDPVVLDIDAPSLAGALKLRNQDQADVTVQTRVFRWVQSSGQETLSPATDVVASPPIVTLEPGSEYTVRVVRVARGPVSGEESYRVVVDELPDPGKSRANTVNILIRQSIPVFFRARGITRPDVKWSYRIEKNSVEVFATNHGDDRLRVASLRLRDNFGNEISFGNGLVGYVLGQSSMTFTTKLVTANFTAAETVVLESETSAGHIQALASRRDQP